MPEDRFVFCKTCGKWDKAWCCGFHNKRREKQKRWKRLVLKNRLYFGYRLLPCIENKHHIFQVALTKLQLISKLKRRNTDARSRYVISSRMSRISVV